MKRLMKNPFYYLIIANGPDVVLISLYVYKLIPVQWFMLLVFFSAFVYRVYIDKLRLKALGLINGNEGYWHIFVLRFRQYSKLMFGKS